MDINNNLNNFEVPIPGTDQIQALSFVVTIRFEGPIELSNLKVIACVPPEEQGK